MLSASLPPPRYRTTKLRVCVPCARARSDRNSGAANVTVNAATPPFTNCRLVIFITSAELIFRRAGQQVGQPGRLRLQLRVAAGPRSGRAQVIRQFRRNAAVEGRCRDLIEEI